MAGSFYDRRYFLKQAALGGAGIALLPSLAWKSDDDVSITILHTNDMHSHIDPFPKNHAQYAGKGGMARRASMVEKIRNEREHVILLDAGDVFQGTPYFNFYGGEPEFKIMSRMKYDAATMGNHDFDNGLEGFDKMLPHASFPFICSNYDFNETILNGKTLNNHIVERGGIKVGLFGLGVELEGLVDPKRFGATKYLDPVKTATDQVKSLRERDCDYIICLSHLGYSYKDSKISDLTFAASTSGIDLIIGGHTHTFLDGPTVVKNQVGKSVLVNQAGWGGLQLGCIEIKFQKKNRIGFVRDYAYIAVSNKEVG